jgi:ATP-dependent Clp protease adaptor protein ClpS
MTEQDKHLKQKEQKVERANSIKVEPTKAPQHNPPKRLPPWRLLLHNDDQNDFDKVIKVIQQLTPLNEQEARERTLEAHSSGLSLILVTHQERAELYVEQFASYSLTASCEPDN